jgi:hypothetical protein
MSTVRGEVVVKVTEWYLAFITSTAADAFHDKPHRSVTEEFCVV